MPTMNINEQLDNSRMYRFMLLVIIAGTTMLYSLTMTLVNIILPQLQGAMSASQDQISWIITLNVLATAIATPLTGSLVSLFGRRFVLRPYRINRFHN